MVQRLALPAVAPEPEPRLEPVVGVEPTTYGLQNRCSTTELNWLKLTLHRSLTGILAWSPQAGFDFARTPAALDRCNGIHFGRVRANGKQFRRNPNTHPRVLCAAKLRRSNFPQNHRRPAINKGESAKGEVTPGFSGKRSRTTPITNPVPSFSKRKS